MNTVAPVRDAVGAATDALAAAGCDTPRLDAELLIADALGVERGALVTDPERPIPGAAARVIAERVRRRVVREPVAYILGRKGFRHIELTVEVARGLPARAFDLVVANLPYVAEDEMPALAPEIHRYEPREALVAGIDGLEAIRELVAQAPAGTRLALEHAPHQGEAVRELLEGGTTRRDLSGQERVTLGTAP